ncbi:MAG TPA: hotdog domain-containing protein [Candidatus Acidoferrum sp.]|nr:hotdog domain-containing protein [Candidatus Acidoferrum sp.]
MKRGQKRKAAPSRGRRRSGGVVTGQFVDPAARAAAPAVPKMGLEASVEVTVPHDWTIQKYDAHLPPILSTPAMIGLMEMAAAQAVRPELPPGAITVGTRIEVDHLQAVTLGATVRASARLAGYEGRFLIFEVEARSGDRVIGRGRVFRAIVNPERLTPSPEQKPRR